MPYRIRKRRHTTRVRLPSVDEWITLSHAAGDDLKPLVRTAVEARLPTIRFRRTLFCVTGADGVTRGGPGLTHQLRVEELCRAALATAETTDDGGSRPVPKASGSRENP